MKQRTEPNTILRKKFGARVRQLRNELGYSQEELGWEADLHRTYIGAIERGEQNVALDNIGKLAKVLKVDLKNLFNI